MVANTAVKSGNVWNNPGFPDYTSVYKSWDMHCFFHIIFCWIIPHAETGWAVLQEDFVLCVVMVPRVTPSQCHHQLPSSNTTSRTVSRSSKWSMKLPLLIMKNPAKNKCLLKWTETFQLGSATVTLVNCQLLCFPLNNKNSNLKSRWESTWISVPPYQATKYHCWRKMLTSKNDVDIVI